VPPTILLDTDGQAHEVPEASVNDALISGWRVPQHADVLAASTRAAREADYGGASGALKATGAGLARGASLGLSDIAARAIGGDQAAADLSGYREENPGLSFGSEFAGALLPAVVSGGGSAPASLAARAGRAVATGAEESLGRVGGAAVGGAAEGALFGAGTGVSELALSDDKLTMERAASVLSSNALFGAGLGAAGGALAKGAEIGLGRAKQAIDDWRIKQASSRSEPGAVKAIDDLLADERALPVGPDSDLGAMDRRGLKEVRTREVDNINEARQPAREQFVQDIEAAHREREAAKDWLAGVADRDADKYTREAAKVVFNQDRKIRSLLDDKVGLAQDPEVAAKALRAERQALETLAEAEPRNIAAYKAEVAAAPAKIREDLLAGKIEGYTVGPGALRPDSPVVDEIIAREFAKRYPQYAPVVDAAMAERKAMMAQSVAKERSTPRAAPERAPTAEAVPAAPAPEPYAPGKRISELKAKGETDENFILRRMRSQGEAMAPGHEERWLGSLGVDWTVPENKAALLKALRDEKVNLSRADLVDMFDPKMIERSHVGDDFGDFHFIHDTGQPVQAVETAVPLPDGPTTPPSAAAKVRLAEATHESNALVQEIRESNPRLADAIDDYTQIAKRKRFHIAEDVDGMGDTAEQEFRTKYGLDDVLTSHRFDISGTDGLKELKRDYHMTKKQVLELRAEYKRRMVELEIPKEDFYHQVSVTDDGTVIDWTANQFNELPVPYVYRLGSKGEQAFKAGSMGRDVPSYESLRARLDKGGVDYAEQTLPARTIAGRGYFEPPGGGVDEVRVANARKAMQEGQREAVQLNVTPSGKITVTNGRHRLDAAIELDKPIKVKWSTGIEPTADDVHVAPRAMESAHTKPATPSVPPLDLDGIVKGADVPPPKELAGFDRVHDMLTRNRQLQRAIDELKTAPASARLDAIDDAIANLGTRTAPPLPPKEEPSGGIGGAMLGVAAGLGGPVGYVAARGTQALGMVKRASEFAADRGAKAASAFLDVGSKGAGKAAPYAPIVATKALAALRYSDKERSPDATTLPELYKARTEEIKDQVHAMPDGTIQLKPAARARMATRLDGLRVTDAIAADRIEENAARRLEWLASQMPKRPDAFSTQVGPDSWRPSDMAMRSWARKAAAADDPYSVIDRAIHGAVTTEDVQAMRATAPEILEDWVQGEIMPRLATLRAKLPYERRLSLSMLSGKPVAPAMDPRILGVLQGHFTDEPGTNSGTQAPKPIAAFGSIKKSLDTPTPAQERGAR